MVAILLGLLGGLMTHVSSQATVVAGVEFEKTVDYSGETLELRGAGLYRYKGLIKVTASALYLPREVDSSQILEDVPKCLVIEYYRDITARDLIRSGDVYLRKNLTEKQLAAIADGVELINGLYKDVKKGDRYTLTYAPGLGTQLLLNGNPEGLIPGADFGKYYFTIWLGERPVSDSMRSDLLALR
jgi:hypothetical protein